MASDLDLDDVAATSPKARAELDELRNRVMRREGKFWSHDNADHWSLNEVACWNYLRN